MNGANRVRRRHGLRSRAAVAVAVATCLAGCTSLPGYVHPTYSESRLQEGRKVLLAPLDMQFYEVSAGGVPEKVKSWSEQANGTVLAATREELRRRNGLDLLELPAVSEAERRALDRAIAMFRRVADNIAVFKESRDDNWTKRERELEFTIGTELQPLSQRLGVDAVLFVDGIDFVSSAGRRVMFVLTTLLFGLPVLPTGTSYLQAGLVDPKTGHVLWFGRDYSMTLGDLRERSSAEKLVAGTFDNYPHAQSQVRQ